MIPVTRFLRVMPMVVLVTTLLSCSDSGTEPPPPEPDPEPASVVIIAPVDTLTSIGERRQLSAEVLDIDGTVLVDQAVSWSAVNPQVLRVSASGEIVSLGNGSTVVIARNGTIADSVALTVHQRAARITLAAPTDTVFALGVRSRWSVALADSLGRPLPDGFTPTEWSSSAPGVATVDSDGLVTPVGNGAVQVSASADGAVRTVTLVVQSEAPVEIDLALAESLQWALEDSASAYELIGVSAAVVVPGQGVWSGVYGRSRPDAVMRPSLSFGFASITKTVVGAVVMDLVEDGILSLTDQVSDWLAPLPNISDNATVGQLLQHLTGFDDFAQHPQIWTQAQADLNRWWLPEEVITSFVDDPPAFAPGAAFSYSNTNYPVLGMIIEQATGATLAAEMRSRLWTPMGLNSFYLGGETPIGSMATGWSDVNGNGQLVDITQFIGTSTHSMRWAAGGIIANAADMARWGAGIYGSNVVLDAGTIDQMVQFVSSNAGLVWTGSGLGVLQYQLAGQETWGHAGAVRGFSSLMVYSPSTGISVAVGVNQDDGSHPLTHFRITTALLTLATAGL